MRDHHDDGSPFRGILVGLAIVGAMYALLFLLVVVAGRVG